MRIVSGGQTGVDRAALDAAAARGHDWGGWAPLNWKAEDGYIPTKYRVNMRECPVRGYLERTRRNVIDSDATLILYCGRLSGGSLMTWEFAEGKDKPNHLVDLTERSSLELRIARAHYWLKRFADGTVNVAGPRESKVPGIYELAKTFLLAALQRAETYVPEGADREAIRAAIAEAEGK
jgi:hypothetical protein